MGTWGMQGQTVAPFLVSEQCWGLLGNDHLLCCSECQAQG